MDLCIYSARYSSQNLMKLEFSRQSFEKKSLNINFMKILPLGAKFFHADGRTDGQINMTNLTVAVCSFANAPKEDRRI
jgi:hypothetical protein